VSIPQSVIRLYVRAQNLGAGKKNEEIEHMKFMTLVKSSETSGPPPPALMEAIAKLSEDGARAGTLLQASGLEPVATSVRVRVERGKVLVLDGPYSETKEVVGGFALFDVDSKQEMIDATVKFMQLHAEYWHGWEGETEIRQLFGPEDYKSQG